MMEEHLLERKGCPLHYWITGEGDAPLIVFTHGAGADHHMFDAQVAALAGHYRTLVWDARGHGCSRPMGDQFSIAIAVADLLAIFDRLSAQRAIVVGQSMGGNIAQELVHMHPERAQALVLVNCACNTFSLSAAERLAVATTPAILPMYPYETLLGQSARAAAVNPEVQAYLYNNMRILTKPELVQILSATTACLRDDPDYRIPRPFLLVLGEHDGTGAIAKQAPIWASRERQRRYAVIPNAGHCSNRDNPEVFNRVLGEFLAAQTSVAHAE